MTQVVRRRGATPIPPPSSPPPGGSTLITLNSALLAAGEPPVAEGPALSEVDRDRALAAVADELIRRNGGRDPLNLADLAAASPASPVPAVQPPTLPALQPSDILDDPDATHVIGRHRSDGTRTVPRRRYVGRAAAALVTLLRGGR